VKKEGLTRRRKRDRKDSEMSLVAYGRSGGWEISVDELDAGDSSEWYTQILAPEVSIYAQIPDPDIVVKVLEFLSTDTQLMSHRFAR